MEILIMAKQEKVEEYTRHNLDSLVIKDNLVGKYIKVQTVNAIWHRAYVVSESSNLLRIQYMKY